ncbi:MAG: alpha/beta fold hydrolase [Wenzhouxiangellaceae bacterium]
MPEGVELRGVQLPGRGNRMAEEPISDIHTAATRLLNAITPLCDRPLVFFGHSNGGLVAYKLAQRLLAQAPHLGAHLQHLVISGKPAPHIPPPKVRHNLSEDELIEELQDYGGTPPELLQHREFMELMTPMIRADFALSELYHPQPGPPLELPVSLWWGADDKIVPSEQVLAWEPYLAQVVDRHCFAGGHFYLHDSRDEVVGRVLPLLEAAMAAA